jgi:hypothetical protein
MDQCNFNKSLGRDMLDGNVFKDSTIKRNCAEFLIKALNSKKIPDYLVIAKLILL